MRRGDFLSGCFIATLLLLALVAMTAQASETRVGSMGGIGYYTRDNSNVLIFPSTIGMYPNEVTAELRAKSDAQQYSLGAHVPLGENIVFGLYLNRPSPIVMPETGGYFPNVSMTDVTDLIVGATMNDMKVGGRLTIGMDSHKENEGYPVVERKQSTRLLSLGGGISSQAMDLALDLSLPGATDERSPAKVTWSGFGVGLTGRAFLGSDPTKIEYVPLGIFRYLGTSGEVDPGVSGEPKSTIDLNQMSLGLGGAANYHLSEGNLLVLAVEAIGLDQQTEDDKESGKTTHRTLTYPGIYLGMETAIRPWLKARMGGSQVYQSELLKEEPKGSPSTESTTHSSQFKLTFGLGFTFKALTVDMAINDGFLFDGPNFVSGEVNSLANRLSVSYAF